MPWPSPRQHEQLRPYRSYTHLGILTRRMAKWYSGKRFGPKASWRLSYRWEKTRKNLTQETCPDRGSNPGPLHDRRACYRLLHIGGRLVRIEYKISEIIIIWFSKTHYDDQFLKKNLIRKMIPSLNRGMWKFISQRLKNSVKSIRFQSDWKFFEQSEQ